MILLLVLPFTATPQAPSFIDVGEFSKERIENKTPSHWKPLTFKNIERHTTYTLAKDGEDTVLKAVSEASASGLTRRSRSIQSNIPSFCGDGRLKTFWKREMSARNRG